MKALILNSGMGTRMGNATELTHKCMMEISPGIPLITHQIETLAAEGITEFVITTGHAREHITKLVNERYSSRYKFDFVFNPRYKETNYIYSMLLAREQLDTDVLLMHGDLYFDRELLSKIIAHESSAVVIDRAIQITDKDFKARIKGDAVAQIATYIMDDECCSCQPLYKLNRSDWLVWVRQIEAFCAEGNTGVYAEEALNAVLDSIRLAPLDARGRLCMEVDTIEDLQYLRQKLERI